MGCSKATTGPPRSTLRGVSLAAVFMEPKATPEGRYKAYDSAARREALAGSTHASNGIVDGIMHRDHARRPLHRLAALDEHGVRAHPRPSRARLRHAQAQLWLAARALPRPAA